MASSQVWMQANGGKSPSIFHQTYDGKFLLKEVKRKEIKMLIEFSSPHYFDYMQKVFFENYPSIFAKIVGVYRIDISQYQDVSKSEDPCDLLAFEKTIHKNDDIETKLVSKTKKYVIVSENLNFGIGNQMSGHDERDVIRFDLKGSLFNRFIKTNSSQTQQPVIVHNFKDGETVDLDEDE